MLIRTNHSTSMKLLPFSTITATLFFLLVSCTQTDVSTETEPESQAHSVVSGETDIDRTFTYAGKPSINDYPNPIKVLYNEGYVSGYDEDRGVPAWVAYRVFNKDEYYSNPRRTRFLIDSRSDSRISHDDYTNSGYDRGHMAPNYAIVSRFGADAQRETYYMTNIIPQTPQLNQQWWQRLEALIARDYSDAHQEVWVIVGPVFKDTRYWLNDKVKVPSHNFKIVITEIDGEFNMKAFLVHQEVEGSEPHEPYLTTVRELERLTGLNFNPLFEESFADSVENIQAVTMW